MDSFIRFEKPPKKDWTYVIMGMQVLQICLLVAILVLVAHLYT